MAKVLQQRVTVLPGGRVEVVSPELREGQTVDVVVSQSSSAVGRSAVDILAEAPGRHCFKTAEEVRAYLAEEKASWNR